MSSFIDLVILNAQNTELDAPRRFLFDNNGHRLVKRLIHSLDAATESSKAALEEAVEKLVACIHGSLPLFLETKGVFVVVAILEHSEYRESLWNFLQKHRPTIDKNADKAGVAILAKILANKP